MKNRLNSITFLLLTCAVALTAAETAPTPIRPTSAEFKRIQGLVGTWSGKADFGQGPIDMTIQYRPLAGGTVIEERIFAGTPQEMVTMYFEKEGKLALTHYCVLGNRPGMLLDTAEGNTLKFKFDKTCGIDVARESHMHALTITFDDAETITTRCKAIIDGKETPDKPTTLKRVKS